MPKFSIWSLLLWLTIAALAVALVMARRELAEKTARLDTVLNEMRYLNIADDTQINAINIPGFGRKSWRWRIYLPGDRRFRLRVAFDDVPGRGIPANAPDNMICELPPGESILSASLNKVNDEWELGLHAETAGRQNFDFNTEVAGKRTEWLDKRGGCSLNLAGNSTTESGSPDQPFVLLNYRDGLSPRPGVTATNPNPTDGVMIWIQEIDPNK